MIKLPLYGKKTIRLAFEFGLILSETAKERGVKITPGMVEIAEGIFLNELKTKSLENIAINFVPLILACFEV